MSQSKQALRARIKSVNSTKKITKAMEMIANAKLFKQRHKMECNREYAQRLQDTVNEIVAKNPGEDSIFLKNKPGEGTITIIYCSDLGLCGSYNSNVMKYANENLKPGDPVFLIGTSMYRQFREAGYNILNEEPISSDRSDFMSLKDLVMDATEMYLRGQTGKVQLLYTRFVNTMTFKPELDQLLPCDISSVQKHVKENKLEAETLFEPDAKTILDHLIPMMIQNVAYADWMESTTAEQGSRRMAMKTASDNADELSADLLLEYNKARQAAITQEITEIVGGSAAV